jgi:hypothetical protein
LCKAIADTAIITSCTSILAKNYNSIKHFAVFCGYSDIGDYYLTLSRR